VVAEPAGEREHLRERAEQAAGVERDPGIAAPSGAPAVLLERTVDPLGALPGEQREAEPALAVCAQPGEPALRWLDRPAVARAVGEHEQGLGRARRRGGLEQRARVLQRGAARCLAAVDPEALC